MKYHLITITYCIQLTITMYMTTRRGFEPTMLQTRDRRLASTATETHDETVRISMLYAIVACEGGGRN